MINPIALINEFRARKEWKLINYIHWAEQADTVIEQLHVEIWELKRQLAPVPYQHKPEHVVPC